MLGGGHSDDRGRGWIAQQLVDRRALTRYASDTRDCAKRPRGLEQRDGLAARGSIEDDQVIPAGGGCGTRRWKVTTARVGADPVPAACATDWAATKIVAAAIMLGVGAA